MSEQQNIPEEQKPISNEQAADVNENLQPESVEFETSNSKLGSENMQL